MLLINFTFMLLSYLIFNVNSELCTYNSKKKYSDLIIKYPELKEQFNTMSEYPIPIWYTDKYSNSLNEIKDTLQNCKQLTSTIIIYGMINKDCDAGESAGGTNKNSNDYINFITNLHKEVNDRSIIYIIEPDALALSMDNKCGVGNNYVSNIKNALDILSQNKNAKIYLDIGYWVLIYNDQQVKEVINIVNKLDPNKKIKGFSLNLSNYRSNTEMISACKKINDLSGYKYSCIIDTSRNANGPDDKNTWCNAKNAGIGNTPTENTENDIIDYFMWLKPAIEVDGHCYNFPNSFHSKESAGGNDPEYFKLLWNNGLLKNNNTNNKINVDLSKSINKDDLSESITKEELSKNNPFNSMELQCKSDDNLCKDNVNKRRDTYNQMLANKEINTEMNKEMNKEINTEINTKKQKKILRCEG